MASFLYPMATVLVMSKVKLNKKQKSIVTNWCSSRKNARIERLIDRTCQYKDAVVAWQLWANQPNNRIAVIYYHTRLELVKSPLQAVA